MEILINILLVAAGLAMLYFGAEWLVRGSINISNRLKISQLVIGLTVVAFGTSTPELAVSISSAMQGLSDVALGNVVGSNIVNIAIILGVSAVIAPIAVSKSTIRKEIPIMIGAALLLLAIVFDGKIDFLDGMILITGIVAFLIFNYKSSKKDLELESVEITNSLIQNKVIPKSIGLVAVGLTLLSIGSFLTVDNAVVIAKSIGISELFIGLTLVAIGTSLPELITSVIAAKKGHADLSIGNIVGSNIFNIFAIVGIASVIAGIAVNDKIIVDMIIMIIFSAVLIPIMRSGFVVSRKEGVILIAGYFAYILILLYR